MNILHLSATKNWGGGENHIENLCYNLKAFPNVKNTIFCTKNGIFHKRLLNKDIPFITAPLTNKMDPQFFVRLIWACKKNKIDLIHIHDTTALALAVIANNFSKLPPFIFSKKTSFPIKNRKQTLYKYNHPNLKKILCVSEKTKEITSLSIKDQQNLTTIYHGTRLDNKSDKTPFLLRKKLKLDSHKIIIGSIANHNRAKNLETFVEVVSHMVNVEKRTDIFFVQIGASTKRTKALMEKVAELKLQHHIAFLGFIPEASNFIPQLDISLITSQSEGIPQVIYESFYHKIPVISTKVGGIPEIIEHNSNGFLAKAHDHKEIARHILSLIQEKELQKNFTEISYEKLLKNFTTKTMAEKTLAEYKKVLHGRL